MFDLRHPFAALYLAPSLLFQLTAAQHNAPLAAPSLPTSSSTPTTTTIPSAVSLSPAALSSAAGPYAAIPTFTDLASPTLVPDNGTSEHSVLNYYFLLLAVFVIVIIVLYSVLLRKRRRRAAQATARRQNALAADLERWPGDGRERTGWAASTRTGRWYVLRPTRPQEGLNERGEAPPAYVAKPEPAHPPINGGEMPPEWTEMARKPPEYEEARHT